MNRIINEYGTLRPDGAAEQALQAYNQYQARISQIIKTHDLTPEEIRCLDSCLTYRIFAEETLRKAFEMKREKKIA